MKNKKNALDLKSVDQLESRVIMRIYSIRDSVACECAPPFVAKNDGIALRMFSQAIEKADARIRYESKLLCLGKMDMTDGKIYPEVREVEVTLDTPEVENEVI